MKFINKLVLTTILKTFISLVLVNSLLMFPAFGKENHKPSLQKPDNSLISNQVYKHNKHLLWEILAETHPQSQLPLARIKLNEQIFTVELALTDKEQELGLMDRTTLAQHEGMLFVFNDLSLRSFWMKNTQIPLDIIFFDANAKLINVEQAEPCIVADSACPIYSSKEPAKYVLELTQGTASSLDFKEGLGLSKP